ncbi:unnamed protein product [Caenorhabditis auriculariae]|uniref:RecQ-mediated genome instability protein 1 n=1 Tax=Caenorhabditis auriculariae TaxID=2777116 RepID=A0A8S1HLL4_9PELO|nr:unnamed protein product [Caenorhabditis auriculariae]
MSCPTAVAHIHRFFRDRYIVLSDTWLQAVLEYLSTKNAKSDPQKLAALVFEQWKFSNFKDSSESVFSKLGLCPNTSRADLKRPIVCQINSIIDVGSSYYSQFSRLSSCSRVDNTGFDTIFNKEENDNDQKSSRMLRLVLSDGQTELKAIELSRIPNLSMYIKPGCKILICPPLILRKGTFLLQPDNCQVLGGECLPQLNPERPLDKYMQLLGLQDKKAPIQKEEAKFEARRRSPRIKIPERPHQIRNRSPSPSEMFIEEEENYDDEVVDWSEEEEEPRRAVRTSLPRLENETIEGPSKRKAVDVVANTPKRRPESVAKPNPMNGMLTTARPQSSYKDSPLKADEEPLNFPSSSGRIKIKKEKSDDDIEVIELDSPVLAAKAVKKEVEENALSEPSPEEPIIKKFKKLNNVSIVDIVKKMRFCVGSRRVNIVGSIENVLDPLRIVDNLWTMKVDLRDDSTCSECLIDDDCLKNLIGMSSTEAMTVRQSEDRERRKNGAKRLKGAEEQLQRLDLVLEVEFFNDRSLLPVIRSVRTMAEVLDVF